MMFDVAVIGAGVVGSLVAREVSECNLSAVLIEQGNDVASGASKANSSIVHAGFDAMPGTLKAKLNVKGTEMMPELCKTLHVPFKQIGSVVVAFADDEMKTLEELYNRGIENGVPELEIISEQRLREIEPLISPEAKGALLAKTAGIVCPYELTIAAAETAAINGVKVVCNYEVKSISFAKGMFTLSNGETEIMARYVINCAGVNAGKVAEMVGDSSIKITARKGEYMLLDKKMGSAANTVIFQCPSAMGKGVLVTQTVDGNLLLGPTSADIDVFDDVSTTAEVLEKVAQAAKRSVPTLNMREVITSFAGIRAHDESGDFVIGVSDANEQFINVAGIESPGLSASPAIAQYALEILLGVVGSQHIFKDDWIPGRKAPVRFRELDSEQRRALIRKDKRYGRIVCRCETVTEGEILDALHSPVPATDLDGVKRRTRAGMGRCQSGFCGSKVAEIIARECNVPLEEVTKFGGESKLLVGKTK